MDLNVEFCDETHVIEVALDDTVEHMRRKVASAVGLPEDSFGISFGDKVMGEGYDMTQLSAGDTIVVKKSMKFEAIAALRALGETDLTPERLEEVEDPEVACLLLQAEVATVIPYFFLEATSITRLDLSAVSTVTRIERGFLEYCRSLTSVDLSSFNSLTYVGYGFLQCCTSLTSLNLSSLNSLTYVGMSFLRNCTSLTSLVLPSLNSLTGIEDGFLQDCRSLTSLVLPSLNRLTYVEDRFLQGCTSLTAVDLSSLNSVTRVGDHFLRNCASLTSLDLSPLEYVAHFGQCSFNECTSLQTIHLSGCSAAVSRAVEEAGLSDLVVEARPKRKRDESPEEDCKRPRLSQ